MDTAISIQRPRPQNLSLCLGTGINDLKSFTASLQPSNADWTESYRSITSATVKNGSLSESEYQASINRAELEHELRQQMDILKAKNAFLQGKSDQVSQETPEKGNINSERPYKNSSPDSNSETQNSGNLSTRELELLLEDGSVKERALIIERLENDLRRMTDERLMESVEKIKVTEERDALKVVLEQKTCLLESITTEKDRMKVHMEVEMGNKLKEITDLKNELTTAKTKQDQLHREVLVSKIISEEKHKKVIALEKEVACLIQEQENSQKVYREMHEAKVLINEFNEKLEISARPEFYAALQLLIEECKKSQEALKEELEAKKQLSEKIKLIEEKALNEVASLEKEKEDLSLKLAEVQDDLEKTKSEFCVVKEDLSQTILHLDTERTSLTTKLEETENLLKSSQADLQNKEGEINEFKLNAEHEKCLLKDELGQYKKESVSSLNEIKDKNNNLQKTISSLDEEKLKLQKKLKEYTDKLEASLKEIAGLQAKNTGTSQAEEKLRQEKEELKKMLEEAQVLSQQQVAEFQECIMNKDLHIQALISDVNQMKEFIVEHHGESVFENEEAPAQEAEEVEEEEQQEEVIEIPEEKEEVVQEQQVEEPAVQDITRNYTSETVETRRTYHGRPWKEELIIYKPKTSSTAAQSVEELESGTRKNTNDGYKEYDKYESAYKNGKLDPLTERKIRDEEITQKQLEKMILELNDKLLQSDKRAKKMVEEKLLEAAKAQQEREDELLAEMEKLKDDKKALLKRIDDMQWEQAYQYTEKAKLQKQEEEKALEAANKQKQQALEASKKKKKK